MYLHAERPHTHSQGQSSVDYGSTKRIRHALKVSSLQNVKVVVDCFYIALFSTLEQTHCARKLDTVQKKKKLMTQSRRRATELH